MKKLIISAAVVTLSVLPVQLVKSQAKVSYGQEVKSKTTILSPDSLKAKPKVDVVINMEMIESFRRCYDKIEVVDWASLLSGVTADEAGILYMAYCRMQTLNDAGNDTKALLAEKDKIKSEIDANTSIRTIPAGEKDSFTTASLESKRNFSNSR
jgi:hypothetical protein